MRIAKASIRSNRELCCRGCDSDCFWGSWAKISVAIIVDTELDRLTSRVCQSFQRTKIIDSTHRNRDALFRVFHIVFRFATVLVLYYPQFQERQECFC